MAYESPINIWCSDTKIEQVRDEYDNLIVRAVQNVCLNVDKDELIRALQYDRGQYEKGFADGIAFEPPVKTRGTWRERRFSEDVYGAECSVCHTTWDYGTNYCPNCGADMRQEAK